MSAYISNEKKLENPISEKVQRNFLGDGCYLKYVLEVTDCNIVVTIKANSWDEMIERLNRIKDNEKEYFGGSAITSFTLKCDLKDFEEAKD